MSTASSTYKIPDPGKLKFHMTRSSSLMNVTMSAAPSQVNLTMSTPQIPVPSKCSCHMTGSLSAPSLMNATTSTVLPAVNVSTPIVSPLVSATASMPVPISAPTSLPPVNAGMAPPPPMVVGVPPPWPPETDLILTPGTNTVMLTLQHALVRLVVRDSFENLRATLLVENAFPNAHLVLTFIQDALTSAARAHLPDSADILEWLETDLAYRARLLSLVSSCAFRLHWTEFVLSHVLGLPSFEVKSRSTVLHLSSRQFQRCIPLPLCNLSRSR